MPNEYTIEKLPSGMFGIILPEKALAKFKGEKRLLCSINNVSFHCAVINHKTGGYYINIGLATLKKIGVKEGMKVKPIFSIDKSKHQFKAVKEFEEVLKTDAEAKSVFNSLTDGGKRSLLYLVSQPKSVDKRIERALLIAERLKQGITSARIILKK
jgi:Bacteriocin-protection, YdeI or OmpD-Associated/Domain of unknown function (DUF1905)